MERSVLPSEGSQRRFDSTSSLIPVNSIVIDLTGPMEEIERPAIHEHFSMRGFVAGMRQKEWKKCYPFGFKGESSQLEDILPPLHVPNFRWWQSCVPVSNSEWSVVPFEGISRGDAGPSSRHDGSGGKEGFSFWDKIDIRHGSRNYAGNYDGPGTVTENPIHIRDKSDNAADASNAALPTAEHVVYEVHEPSKASSGNVTALPPRRKPKLRSLADIMVDEQNVENPRPRSKETEPAFDGREKGIRIPQVKRKVALSQDNRGNIPQLKRKILPQDHRELTGKTKRFKPVEDSDTESEENAQNRFDLQQAAKTQLIKPNKIKSVENVKRTQVENAASVPTKDVSKMNSDGPANSHNQSVSTGIGSSMLGLMEETGGYPRSSLSGQEMGRLPNVEFYDNGSGGATLGDGSKGKMVLDLSLSSSANVERCSGSRSCSRPNGEIPDLNETFPQSAQNVRGKQWATVSEKKSLPQYKNLDISASSSKGAAAREGTRQLPMVDQHTQNTEMDIIEMLARSKMEKERALSRNHLNGYVRGSTTPYADNHPGIARFPFANARTVPDGNSGSFSHLNNKSLFNSFGMKTRLPASSSRPTERPTNVLWPPRGQTGPFHQNIPFQANNIGVPSFPVEGQRGRTISDVKDQEERQAGRMDTQMRNPTHVGSLDPYSNDHIPAMQLLSLMDRGVPSGMPFKVGPRSFIGKSLSPCNNHPPPNENRNFFNGSFVPQVGHSKDFLGLHFGGASSSRQFPGQSPLNSGGGNMVGPRGIITQPPAGHTLQLGPCSLNRNPADFSIPDGRNEYTRTSRDMKPPRRRSYVTERSPDVNLGGQKRQRAKKDMAGANEYTRK